MKKYSVMLLLVALVLAIVPVVSAQDTLGASQEDYNLWTAANANLSTMQSASYSFTAAVTTTGMGESNATINLTGNGVLDTNPASPKVQLDLTGSAVTTETTPINLSARVVDGTLYLNNNNEGWQGMTADSLSAFGMPTDPTTLAQNPMFGELMTGLAGVQASEFLTLSSADHSGLKAFTVNVDVAELLSSPAAAPLFGAMMGTMNGEQQMDAAQLQQMQGMMAGMLGTATVSVSQLVDPATQQVQQITLDADIPLDMIVGPGATVSIDFQVNLSNLNQPVTVEAPADAVMSEATGG